MSEVTEQRRVFWWLDEYSRYHLNPVNKLIHWICIPAIMMTLLGILWSLPVPEALGGHSTLLNWSSLLILVSMFFYLSLSLPLAIGMGVITVGMLACFGPLESVRSGLVWQLSVAVFVLAWIVQFIGHKIEGKKPAFFQDIQFLLVGPMWLLADVYKRLKIPI